MTDYELGFAQGEAEAWRRRNEPLPTAGEIHNDRDRGYWSARLPRSAEWANGRDVLNRFQREAA